MSFSKIFQRIRKDSSSNPHSRSASASSSTSVENDTSFGGNGDTVTFKEPETMGTDITHKDFGAGEDSGKKSHNHKWTPHLHGHKKHASGSQGGVGGLNGQPVATDDPGSAPAVFSLSSSNEQFGAAQQQFNTAEPGSSPPNLLQDRTGVPVTHLPGDAAGGGLSGVLTSGAKGLGPEGHKTLTAIQSSTTAILGGEKIAPANAVVAPAKGTAPEMVIHADKSHTSESEPEHHEEAKQKKIMGIPIPKKVEATIKEVKGETHGEGGQPEGHDKLAALNTVAPAGIIGVNLSAIGLSSPDPDAPKDEAAQARPGLSRQASAASITPAGAPKELQSKEPSAVEKNEETGEEMLIGQVIPALGGKEDKEFKELFEMLPKDDRLVDDFICALQRDILVQGKLYISENHLAFHANIMGFETNLVIPWSEVVTLEKRMTAFVIPNAIEVATLHARHTFASFVKRDTAYDTMVGVWSLTHPNTDPSPHIASDDVNSVADAASVDNESVVSAGGTRHHRFSSILRRRRKSKEPKAEDNGGQSAEDIKEEYQQTHGDGADAHAPTEDPGPFYDDVVMDVVFPSTPEQMFKLLFKEDFMKSFWTENQKLLDLSMGPWTPIEPPLEKRDMSYIKPLNASLGPKKTKCVITDENVHVEPDNYISNLTTTSTPDVPSGNQFCVRTKTSLTWAKGGGCKVYVTCTVEWSKVNRFLKGIIEKSALDGQKQYHQDLQAAIRAYIKSHPDEFVVAGGAAGDAKEAVEAAGDEEPSTQNVGAAKPTGILGQVLNIVKPLASPTIVMASIIAVLLVSNLYMMYLVRSRAEVTCNAVGPGAGNHRDLTSAVGQMERDFRRLREAVDRLGAARINGGHFE